MENGRWIKSVGDIAFSFDNTSFSFGQRAHLNSFYEKRGKVDTFFSFLHRMKTERVKDMGSITKTVGVGVMAFGCGILVAFFLPESVLIVLEAGVIVTSGILFSKG